MERVVYFLGAGFSAPLGFPVMGNFLEVSKDIYFKNPERYKYFQKVFDAIAEMSVSKNYYDSNLFNIEEILSILEMKGKLDNKSASTLFKKYIIDVINEFQPDLKKLDNSTKSWQDETFGDNKIHNQYGFFICSLLNIALTHQEVHPLRNHPDNFNVIRNNDNTYQYSIVTLNYDLVIEAFIKYLNDHFKPSNLIISNDYSNSQTDLYLAKLHGSIDTNEIIAPTWNKILHKREIKNNWELAYKLLSEANHIRIIGYSLPITDSYIKYLFKAAIIKKQTPHLKSFDVIALDSDGSVKKRYDEFIHFHNYRFKSQNFIKYLQLNHDKILKKLEIVNTHHNITRLKTNYLEEIHKEIMNE